MKNRTPNKVAENVAWSFTKAELYNIHETETSGVKPPPKLTMATTTPVPHHKLSDINIMRANTLKSLAYDYRPMHQPPQPRNKPKGPGG